MKATDILMAEHDNILLVLGRLTQVLVSPLEESLEEVDFILNFVADYSDEYHHMKEEKIYFEWIGTHSPSLKGGPVSCMLDEHTTFRDLIANAKNALIAFKLDHQNDGAREAVITSLNTFVSLLKSHIDKENTMLYQMAERLDDELKCGDAEMLSKYNEVEIAMVNKVQKYDNYLSELRSSN
jgi:hemerythrin-like domain-containing protein